MAGKGYVMKRAFLDLVVGCATLLVASAAFAQSSEKTRFDAPQPFVVGTTSLPPGTYYIWPVKEQDRMLWQVANEDRTIHVFFHTVPVVRDRNHEAAAVRFNTVDGRQRLAAVFTEGTIYGRELVGADKPLRNDFGSGVASGTKHKRSHDHGTDVARHEASTASSGNGS